MAYYKATDVEGRSFRDPSITLAVGKVTRHPSAKPMVPNDASTYLSASTEPADCTGFVWPCRLFEVEPVGDVLDGLDYPHKRAAKAFRVVHELPATEALGPNGEAVAAFIARCRSLNADELERLAAAWTAAWTAAWNAAWDAAGDAARNAARASARDAAWNAARASARNAARDAAWDAAWNAAWDAAGDAAWDAAGDAAWDAAWALVVKDLITPEQFATLTKSWRDAGLELPE